MRSLGEHHGGSSGLSCCPASAGRCFGAAVELPPLLCSLVLPCGAGTRTLKTAACVERGQQSQQRFSSGSAGFSHSLYVRAALPVPGAARSRIPGTKRAGSGAARGAANGWGVKIAAARGCLSGAGDLGCLPTNLPAAWTCQASRRRGSEAGSAICGGTVPETGAARSASVDWTRREAGGQTSL